MLRMLRDQMLELLLKILLLDILLLGILVEESIFNIIIVLYSIRSTCALGFQMYSVPTEHSVQGRVPHNDFFG